MSLLRVLSTERIEAYHQLCWIERCKYRGRHWIHWSDAYPSVRVCGVHLRPPAMSSRAAYPVANPLPDPRKKR